MSIRCCGNILLWWRRTKRREHWDTECVCCVFDCRLGVCGDKSSSVVITAAVLAMAIIINYIGLMIIKETMLGERETR